MVLNAVVISILACLLNLLSIHYPDQAYGLAVLKTLLLPRWYQKLNTHLHGSHSESILVTIKLYTAMANFAGGREKKTVMEVFTWDKRVAKLLNMRRRGKSEKIDTLSRPGECQCLLFCPCGFTIIV
jgi:nucleolar pre-ribosomal-associated protein 1